MWNCLGSNSGQQAALGSGPAPGNSRSGWQYGARSEVSRLLFSLRGYSHSKVLYDKVTHLFRQVAIKRRAVWSTVHWRTRVPQTFFCGGHPDLLPVPPQCPATSHLGMFYYLYPWSSNCLLIVTAYVFASTPQKKLLSSSKLWFLTQTLSLFITLNNSWKYLT